MEKLKQSALDAIENSKDLIASVADQIWEYAELSLQEVQSAALYCKVLKEQGFTVEEGICGIPTAFAASYGSGKPVIGILAEYDALSGLSQKGGSTVKEELTAGGNGHGCGHNLLGTGIAAAACALAYALEQENLPGQVVVYGCPEEEICRGKIVMANAHCFDRDDAAISWHPADKNQVSEEVFQAMTSRVFRFYGKSAHAAASPEMGRSALDAAELTNVAVNYLREHVPTDVRMHYVYTHAGDKPNIVPNYAELWYYIRAASRKTMLDADRRVILAAEGAAHATETRMETEELTRSPETLLNRTLMEAMHRQLEICGAPRFTQQDKDFAAAIQKELGLPGPALEETLRPLGGSPRYVPGSTDVSAVSWRTPTVTLNTVCQARGIPGHHWSVTACSGVELGRTGMSKAAQIMACFGRELCLQPELLRKARDEFEQARCQE